VVLGLEERGLLANKVGEGDPACLGFFRVLRQVSVSTQNRGKKRRKASKPTIWVQIRRLVSVSGMPRAGVRRRWGSGRMPARASSSSRRTSSSYQTSDSRAQMPALVTSTSAMSRSRIMHSTQTSSMAAMTGCMGGCMEGCAGAG
jgi:hypothetical protein